MAARMVETLRAFGGERHQGDELAWPSRGFPGLFLARCRGHRLRTVKGFSGKATPGQRDRDRGWLSRLDWVAQLVRELVEAEPHPSPTVVLDLVTDPEPEHV